jgi:hypothetical protein
VFGLVVVERSIQIFDEHSLQMMDTLMLLSTKRGTGLGTKCSNPAASTPAQDQPFLLAIGANLRIDARDGR